MKKIIRFLVCFFCLLFMMYSALIKPKASGGIVNYDLICLEYANIYGEGNYNLSDSVELNDFIGNTYLLQRLSPTGYIIIDPDTQKFLEGNFNGVDPYIDYDVNMKFYLGPLNYFVEIGGYIYDIANETYVEDIDSLIEFSTVFKNNIVSSVAETTSVASTYGSVVDSSGFTLVEHHEYFRNLYTFPDNIDGSCGYVALSIILGYLDTFYNGNTIPNEDISSTEVNEAAFFNKGSDEPLTSRLPNDAVWTLWTNNLGGTTNTLQEELINLGGYSNEIWDNGVLIGWLYDIYLEYEEKYITNPTDYIKTHVSAFVSDDIKYSIDNGIPCIAGLLSASYNSSSSLNSIRRHAVVVYGYKNNSYLTNFGWKNGNNNEIVISDVTFNGMFSIEYAGEHIHSDNLIWSRNNQTGSFCPCGYVECNHTLTSYSDELKHYQNCVGCNYTYECLHQFLPYGEGLICVTCGYRTDQCVHNFIYYNSYDAMTHNLICNMCGYQRYEYHILSYFAGKYTCDVCPYEGGSETLVPGINPYSRRDEDEED